MTRLLPLLILLAACGSLLAACGASDHTPSPDGGDRDAGRSSDGGCAAGLTLCGDACVDLQTDSTHCGECGLVCGDSFCNRGTCDSSCGSGTVACGTRCCPDPPGCDATGSSCAPPTDAGVASCPADPPADGSACTTPGQSCLWLRCDTDGEVTASCEAGSWSVATAACDEFECAFGGGNTCTDDQLCVARIGGAFLVDCQANPCGTGPVEESCACDACGGAACTSVEGRSVSCNTCPGPEPCP